MKKLLLITVIMGMTALCGHAAQAFSTVQQDGQNADGSPKFADPDEQRPAMIATPAQNQSGWSPLSMTAGRVTPPTTADITPGAAAFDQAYTHKFSQDR
jgi:hypothetical protein